MTFRGFIQVGMRFDARFNMWIPTKQVVRITSHHEYSRHALNSLLTLFALYLISFSPQILFQLPGRPHVLCLYQKDVSSLNDLRPVAFISAVMKVCERVVLCKLDSLVTDYIDPLQFVYRRNRSIGDVVLYALKHIYSLLEKKEKRRRKKAVLYDWCSSIFSSAFNTTTFSGSETFKHEIAITCYFMDLWLPYK